MVRVLDAGTRVMCDETGFDGTCLRYRAVEPMGWISASCGEGTPDDAGRRQPFWGDGDGDGEEGLPYRPLDRDATARFVFAPTKRAWCRPVGVALGSFAAVEDDVEIPLDRPPARFGCWLLPSTDDAALDIARRRLDLARLGWRCFDCEERVVFELSDKVSFRDRARRLGRLEFLPRHYASLEEAEYPCVLKRGDGEYGSAVRLVADASRLPAALDDLGLCARDCDEEWLFQECVPGHVELSTSLLVLEGRVLDAVRVQYTYEEHVYCWPRATERAALRVVDDAVPADHLRVMARLCHDFSGICNFNYKLRPDGRLCVFEVNPRLGADLACDVPRERLRLLLERLDGQLPLSPRFATDGSAPRPGA